MEAFLRDGFLNNSPVYLLPYLVLTGVLLVMPVIRLYNATFVEKGVDFRLGILGLAAHLIIAVVLFSRHYLGGLLLYAMALTILWLLSPLYGAIQDRWTIRSLSNRDIARYKYMLTLDPNDANALVGLANAYLARGMCDEAIAAYEKAKAIDPLHTGVISSRLQGLVDSRIVHSINQKGMRIVSKNDKLLNMEATVTVEYVSKDDGPDIPEL